MGVTGTVSNYLFYKSLAPRQKYLRQVTFTAGHNVFTDLIRREDRPKTTDVTLLGSCEGHRKKTIEYLRNALAAHGVRFNKAGGMLDSTKRTWQKGLRLSDDWVTWERYVETINESKICINTQSDPARVQIKGKGSGLLAASVADNAALYTTATAGQGGATASSQSEIVGARAAAASGSSAANTDVEIDYPHCCSLVGA